MAANQNKSRLSFQSILRLNQLWFALAIGPLATRKGPVIMGYAVNAKKSNFPFERETFILKRKSFRFMRDKAIVEAVEVKEGKRSV